MSKNPRKVGMGRPLAPGQVNRASWLFPLVTGFVLALALFFWPIALPKALGAWVGIPASGKPCFERQVSREAYVAHLMASPKAQCEKIPASALPNVANQDASQLTVLRCRKVFLFVTRNREACQTLLAKGKRGITVLLERRASPAPTSPQTREPRPHETQSNISDLLTQLTDAQMEIDRRGWTATVSPLETATVLPPLPHPKPRNTGKNPARMAALSPQKTSPSQPVGKAAKPRRPHPLPPVRRKIRKPPAILARLSAPGGWRGDKRRLADGRLRCRLSRQDGASRSLTFVSDSERFLLGVIDTGRLLAKIQTVRLMVAGRDLGRHRPLARGNHFLILDLGKAESLRRSLAEGRNLDLQFFLSRATSETVTFSLDGMARGLRILARCQSPGSKRARSNLALPNPKR